MCSVRNRYDFSPPPLQTRAQAPGRMPVPVRFEMARGSAVDARASLQTESVNAVAYVALDVAE